MKDGRSGWMLRPFFICRFSRGRPEKWRYRACEERIERGTGEGFAVKEQVFAVEVAVDGLYLPVFQRKAR
ncbi:MAG: hypothetical protein SPE01_11820 [Candidatus Spyradocola sp.]|nr:hypothetical protein [Candidatus Spyradocola sp.]